MSFTVVPGPPADRAAAVRQWFTRTLREVGGGEPKSDWEPHPQSPQTEEQAVVQSLSVVCQQAAQFFRPQEALVVETFGHVVPGQAHFELKVRSVPVANGRPL